MDERDDYAGTNPAPVPARTGPADAPPPRSAAEQAGPASWAESVPSGSTSGQGADRTGVSKGAAGRAAEKASEIAREAGQQAQGVASRKKDEAADRLGRVAQALHEAARSLQQGEDGSALPRYVDAAASRLERAAGYLRERDLRSMAREVEDVARQRPELFVAGSVLTGIALARFLKSSARRRAQTSGYESPGEGRGGY
jgi:hypothetical protein